MKCIVLVNNIIYNEETRMQCPTALLEVQGKKVLDWLIDDISMLGIVDEYIIMTSEEYVQEFQKWASSKRQKTIVCTHSLEFLGREKIIFEEDVLLLEGNTLLDFSLTEFIRYARDKKTSCVMRYYEPNVRRLKQNGAFVLGEEGQVLGTTGKAVMPKSYWCCLPFYYYIKTDVIRWMNSEKEVGGIDEPIESMDWLSNQTCVHTMKICDKSHIIDSWDSYKRVRNDYTGKNRYYFGRMSV